MPDTVRIDFLFPLGTLVRWAEEPDVRWRVIERFYREGVVSRYVRYRLQAGTQDRMAYEIDLEPWEDA